MGCNKKVFFRDRDNLKESSTANEKFSSIL